MPFPAPELGLLTSQLLEGTIEPKLEEVPRVLDMGTFLISTPQPSHVQQPQSIFGSTSGYNSSAGLQAHMSDTTNRQNPSKRSVLGEGEENDDQKRVKTGHLAFEQTTEPNKNSDTPDDYDLIDFNESPWDNQAGTAPTHSSTYPAATSQVSSSTRSGSVNDQEDAMMEDVFAPLPIGQARSGRLGGLASSRWNRPSEEGSEHSENDAQQMVDSHRTSGRTAKS
ncbi:hypothetical protein SLS62_010231, partial [Diatrype stigma]